MRSLATSAYTAAQVEARLRAGNASYTSRFELLDANNNSVGDISDLVTSATREFDATRPIKGALRLQLLADDDLADALFRYRVKPWFGVVMGDGGVAEYAQGVYVWTRPKRQIGGLGDETWDITLGDLTHLLDLTGPGLDAYVVYRETPLTVGIQYALVNAGFTDTSGVVHSEITGTDFLSWSIRRNQVTTQAEQNPDSFNTTPTTWLSIITQLTQGLGYYDVWFDPDGLPVVEPAADLSTASAEAVYATGEDGIMLTPLEVDSDLSEIANRVFARSKTAQPTGRGSGGGQNAPLTVGVADANVVLPGHPLSEAKIGMYVDQVVDNEVVSTQAALEAQARAELFRRITAHGVFSTPSLAWPTHEGYDLVGLQFAGDRDLDTPHLFLEDQFSLVLAGGDIGTMDHRLRSVVDTDAI